MTKLSLSALTENQTALRPLRDGRVGVTGFEPATSCSQSRRATKLRYTPLVLLVGVEPTNENRF